MEKTYRGTNLYANSCLFTAVGYGVMIGLVACIVVPLMVLMGLEWYVLLIPTAPFFIGFSVLMIYNIAMYRHYSRVTLTDVQLAKPCAYWFGVAYHLSLGFEVTKDGETTTEHSPSYFNMWFLKGSDYPNKPYRVGYDPEKKRWVIIKVVMDESDIE